MDSDRKTICDQCRKQVSISDIRYIQRGKDSIAALCPDCRNWRGSTPKTEDANVVPSQPVLPAKTAPKIVRQKRVYFCSLCRHKFKLDPIGKSRLVCPFCGRTNGVEEFEVQSADELIRRIDV